MRYSDSELASAAQNVVWQISHDVGGLGRVTPETTSRVVRLAVELWPAVVPLPHAIAGREAHAASARAIKARIRQQYEQRYGMGIIATLILSAVISHVVQALIRRWWGGRGGFRQELRMAQYALVNR